MSLEDNTEDVKIADGWDQASALRHLADLARDIHALEARAEWLDAQARNARAEAEIRRRQRQKAGDMFSVAPMPRGIVHPGGARE